MSLTPIALLAGREFRAYVATASFWVALMIGPLAMLAIAWAAAAANGSRTPVAVSITAADSVQTGAILAALNQAAALEGKTLVLAMPGAAAPSVKVRGAPSGQVFGEFDAGFPLSPTGRALTVRTLERNGAWAALGRDPLPPNEAAPAQPRPIDTSSGTRGGRFVLVMILWLTLTGSLGMLLQAVVRERANKALESLLAAVAPWQIVIGKLVGIGAVSLLVLGTWLGVGAVLGGLGSATGPFAEIARPALLAQAGALYLLGFLFYGLVTIALGASAGDVAAAQNYSRPMFAVLLGAFFVAMTGAKGVNGLALAPPFAPFILLLNPAPWPITLTGVAALLGAAGAAGWAATRRLRRAACGA
jgi:ABC-2 type transport system permease protein